MQQIDAEGMSFLVFPKLAEQPGLRHGVSLRRRPAGSAEQDVNFAPSDVDRASANIEQFCGGLGLAADNVARIRQVHGNRVEVLKRIPEKVPEADAVCTAEKGLSVMLLGADCPLILLYDPVVGALGLAHAGWRGTVGMVVLKLVSQMRKVFGSEPQNIRAGIGPGICGRCYRVGMEVVRQAQQNLRSSERFLRPDLEAQATGARESWSFDLVAANQLQLVEAGMSKNNIETSGCCTFEQGDWFHSHRRDGARAGRWALLAGLV